jgi:hypothetical protein
VVDFEEEMVVEDQILRKKAGVETTEVETEER